MTQKQTIEISNELYEYLNELVETPESAIVLLIESLDCIWQHAQVVGGPDSFFELRRSLDNGHHN